MLDPAEIRRKFGGDYVADGRTFKMGIDQRFTRHIAERFRGRRVLETCTGAGFTTIPLARAASHVVTFEIDPENQRQALQNVERAGLLDKVTFVAADVLGPGVLDACPPFDSAFLDPDWADSGPGHLFRFRRSNMRPPADTLLDRVFGYTPNAALILPPHLEPRELEGLPEHERELLCLGGRHELYCLYFGNLSRSNGATEARF